MAGISDMRISINASQQQHNKEKRKRKKLKSHKNAVKTNIPD